MYPRCESLMSWLKHERDNNQLWLWLMGEKFDLDGASASNQPELAWRAVQNLLLLAVELYLHRRGVRYQDIGDDPADRACVILDTLDSVNNSLAAEAWELLLWSNGADLASQVQRIHDFTAERLDVPMASRASTIRAWADGVEMLRDLARGLGLARSDSWYLQEETSPDEQIGWYEEVLSLLDQHQGAGSERS